jgi:type IV pilus biogenesis protein CpaD/CtpE
MQNQRRPFRVPSTPVRWLLGTLVALTVGCAQSDPDDSSASR